MATLRLRRDEIHLWFVFCDEIADASLLSRCRGLLSEPEREQELRFHSVADRHRYLLTRALVRTVLSRYAPVPAQSWLFAQDRYGRPAIVNPEPAAAEISFNISHSHRLVLLGVTGKCALGVDVESTGERTPTLELADRYFAPAESGALRALPSAAQSERFFEYWTLKESYIKARGKGLSLPLDQFSFGIRKQQLSLQVSPELDDDAARWRFWLIRPCTGYVAAICAGRLAGGRQALVARRIVPLLAERPLEYIELGRTR